MTTTKFEAGKPATIMQSQFQASPEPVATVTVTRIMKRWLETDDGKKWYPDGSSYPKSSFRSFGMRRLRLVPGTSADIELRARANDARDKLRRLGGSYGLRLSDQAAIDILERWERDIKQQEEARARTGGVEHAR